MVLAWRGNQFHLNAMALIAELERMKGGEET